MSGVLERHMIIENRGKSRADGRNDFKVLDAFLVVDKEHGTFLEPNPLSITPLRRGDTGGVTQVSGDLKHDLFADPDKRITHIDFFDDIDAFWARHIGLHHMSGLATRDPQGT